jgi:glucose/mannose-6-phosphate isomerase
MQYQSKDLAQFPNQIKYALQHYRSHGYKADQFDNIILSGLGGSGIAGRIAKSYFFDSCPVPVEVVSDYVLPAYAGKRTLAIMCSYSGNTEETLMMYDEAKKKGCSIIAIATGGKIGENAKRDNYLFYQAETGFQPRMALGYSLTYLLLLFGELMGKDARPELEKAAEALANEEKYRDAGKKLLQQVQDDLPKKIAVVTDYYSNPVGLRFCQQIQENAKGEAFLHELPEANHNVIESYYGKLDSIIFFINSHIQPRTELRFSFLKNVLKQNDNRVIEVSIDHNSLLSFLETIYILDWLSLWIADFKGVNSIQIKNISSLKEFLSQN